MVTTETEVISRKIEMPEGRILSLDGWRGIAILMVIVEHLQLAKLGRPLERWTETGQHGVTIFFVLSGFLITSKLMEKRHGIKHFYARRFFRLMPAAWFFLFVTILLHRFYNVRLYPSEFLGSLFFYRNYVTHGFITQHYWSLSLEEQFYLLWPALLLLCGHRRAKWLAPVGAAAIAVWRASNWSWYNRYPFDFRSEVRADALLVGCALALLLAEPKTRAFLISWSRKLVLPMLAILIFCTAFFPYLPPLFENLSIAILIAATVLHPRAFPARFLTWKPLVWLGTVSYSLYLWQGLLAMREWSWFASFYFLLLAILSYYYIERPCIRLGSRLLSRRSLRRQSVELVREYQ